MLRSGRNPGIRGVGALSRYRAAPDFARPPQHLCINNSLRLQVDLADAKPGARKR